MLLSSFPNIIYLSYSTFFRDCGSSECLQETHSTDVLASLLCVGNTSKIPLCSLAVSGATLFAMLPPSWDKSNADACSMVLVPKPLLSMALSRSV